mmetsp:Transcript_10064/g.15243  ORF Transcript_10064/g.15243 Transcript_10064/m.15243 type:complete len:86 (-) Transcript_10064:115-372(-)
MDTWVIIVIIIGAAVATWMVLKIRKWKHKYFDDGGEEDVSPDNIAIEFCTETDAEYVSPSRDNTLSARVVLYDEDINNNSQTDAC